MPVAYLDAARQMGQELARRGLHLVYGAGCTGVMGALADGALEAGGEVTGVIPRLFTTPQLMHTGLTHVEIVDTMHQRKARLVEMADAFVALPGGYGTFEELFEVLTWAQIGLHRKPIGIFNALGYFDPLLRLVDHARQQGFIYGEHQDLYTCADQPSALLDALANHTYPPGLEQWLTRESA
jgi:hypothetical protein